MGFKGYLPYYVNQPTASRAVRAHYQSSRRRRSGRRGGPSSSKKYKQRLIHDQALAGGLNRLKDSQLRMPSSRLGRILRYSPIMARDIQGSGSGIKPYHYCKQVFAMSKSLGDGATVPYPAKWLLNSTFEPEEGVSSHQPMGRDLMATIYNDYTVISCKYTVFVRNNTENTKVRGWIHADTSSTSAVTSYQEAMERPDCQVFYLGASSEHTQENVTLSGYVKIKDHMLATTGDFGSQMTAGVGANPATTVRLHLQIEQYDGTTIGSGTIIADAQLQYYVVYKTPIGVTES